MNDYLAINKNNLHTPKTTNKKLVLKESTVFNAKIRYFYRRNTIVPSGLELLFKQDGIIFTTVILLKDFFSNPYLTLNHFISLLDNVPIYLIYSETRINQTPYFQFNTVLNTSSLNQNIFNEYLKPDLGYSNQQLFNSQPFLDYMQFQKYLVTNKTTFTPNKTAFVSMLLKEDVNWLISNKFYNEQNNIIVTGFLSIKDFLTNPTYSMTYFLQLGVEYKYDLKFYKKVHAGYFFYSSHKLCNTTSSLDTPNTNKNDQWFNLNQVVDFNTIARFKVRRRVNNTLNRFKITSHTSNLQTIS